MTAVPTTPTATRALTLDAAAVLHDRMLLMEIDPPPELPGDLDAEMSGVVLAGANAAANVRHLRRAHPAMVLLIEPASASNHIATPQQPFAVDNDDTLVATSLEDVLQGQRSAGASLAITPSGQIRAQDSAALKALIQQANEIEARDVLTLVPISELWLTPQWIRQLCGVLAFSNHPVLLGLVNGSHDPLQRAGAIAGYHRVAHEVPNAVAWRTDLSGFGFLSHGGSATSIGLRPSLRRYTEAGKRGRAGRPADRHPHVLLSDQLRFSRTSWLQRLFASADPTICECPRCGGATIDRFGDTAEWQALATLHNAACLQTLANQCLTAPNRASWFTERIDAALASHLTLSNHVQKPVDPPVYLNGWKTESAACALQRQQRTA